MNHKVVVLLSDGECDEGTVWEAAMFSSHHKLNNLIAIIDYNKIQSLDTIQNTLGLEPFKQKWESFGWEAIDIDGHDHSIIKNTFSNLSSGKISKTDKPPPSTKYLSTPGGKVLKPGFFIFKLVNVLSIIVNKHYISTQ